MSKYEYSLYTIKIGTFLDYEDCPAIELETLDEIEECYNDAIKHCKKDECIVIFPHDKPINVEIVGDIEESVFNNKRAQRILAQLEKEGFIRVV